AVQIIHAVAERDLRERQSQADPVRSQMVDVIEVNATHGKISKLLERRGAFYVGKHGRLRLKRERNKTCKTAGLILQFAKLEQMINALSECRYLGGCHGAPRAATP